MVDKRQDHSADLLAQKYRGLLDISESIVSYRDLSELFSDLEEKLRQVIDFDFAFASLYDQQRNDST
jgi:Zn-dependent M32 family carboxypeptidase